MSELGFKLFENGDLVPREWLSDNEAKLGERFRVFNPTITAVEGGYAMCYRVVQDGSSHRWLATCKLDADFNILPDSITPLSDHLKFAEQDSLNERALTWHADPRYFTLKGRLFLSWNDGANRPGNNQFLMEMDAGGLMPAGTARVMNCVPRREVEKNWMLFDHDGEVFATYSIAPFSVLQFDLDQPDRLDGQFVSLAGWQTEYETFYGVLRGSAQPIRIGDRFVTLAHSSFKSTSGRVYCACFYSFPAALPLRVTAATAQPFELPNPKGETFDMPRLNGEVAEVVYPCGMVAAGSDLVISYGINDESCAIAVVPTAAVEAALEPVDGGFAVATLSRMMQPTPVPQDSDYAAPRATAPIPLMWWDCLGKKFDGSIGNRKFKTGNFGDIASRDIVEALLGRPTEPITGGQRKLISIGSVIHTASQGDIIWGSGMKGTKMMLNENVKELSVHAVRGPLTLDMVRRHGIDISKVNHLFDPGCLIPHLFAGEVARAREGAKTGGYRIIPHYRDDMVLRRKHYRHVQNFVSVDCTPMQMIEATIGADRVVSSSLHGLIFAESLGIPACWLAPVGGEDDLKYYDYYYGTGRFAVKRFDSLEEALRAEPMPLPRFDFQSYVDSFPREEVLRMGASGVALGTAVSFSQFEESKHRRHFAFLDLGHEGAEGIWGTAKFSRLRTNVLTPSAGEMVANLLLRPFNHADFLRPQAIGISINGGPVTEVEWSKGETDEVAVRIPFVAEDFETPVEIIFQARNCRSPKSMGIPTIEAPITFCLKSLSFHQAA